MRPDKDRTIARFKQQKSKQTLVHSQEIREADSDSCGFQTNDHASLPSSLKPEDQKLVVKSRLFF